MKKLPIVINIRKTCLYLTCAKEILQEIERGDGFNRPPERGEILKKLLLVTHFLVTNHLRKGFYYDLGEF